MAARPSSCPPVLGLFQKRIDGDDALLELASLRFGQAGLGPEFYAETPEELEHLLRCHPPGPAPAMVHLARWIDVLNPHHRRIVMDFGSRFSGRIRGMVVHDQPEAMTMQQEYLSALTSLGFDLESAGAPLLFVEYAAGLDPEDFKALCRRIRDRVNVNPCLDTGHLAIRRVRHLFGALHPGRDVCDLRPDSPELPDLIADIRRAADGAREEVIRDILEVCGLGGPVHLHLHDGHPLSHISPFGVSDHLSFLHTISLPFAWEGQSSVPGVFGPDGLVRIVKAVSESPCGGSATMTLEIHPVDGRLPLGDAAGLFGHWTDMTNAEKMNHWLSVLAENHGIILQSCAPRRRP